MSKCFNMAICFILLGISACNKDNKEIEVANITLNRMMMTMVVGEQQILLAIIDPDNATNKSVTWVCDNPNIISVDDGKVTAIAPGMAVVSAKAGNKSAACLVTVTSAEVAVTNITLSKTSLSLYVGDKETLTASVVPGDATNKSVIWSSSPMNVASIDAITGEITALSVGEAIITATTEDGGKTATCTVTVIAKSLEGSVEGVWQAINAITEKETITYTDRDGIVFTLENDGTYAWEMVYSDPNVVRGVSTGSYSVSIVARSLTCNGTMYIDGGKLTYKDENTYYIEELTSKTMVISENSSTLGLTKITFKKKDKIRIAKVITLAGNGTAGFAEGTGTAARFNGPTDVAVDILGNVYVADKSNYRIRKITPAGMVSTLAGSGTAGFADGTSTMAKFAWPRYLTIDVSNNLYVSDAATNKRIRIITPEGVVSTLANAGTQTQFSGLTIDEQGNIYAVSNHSIYKITTTGMTVFAGSGVSGLVDGKGTAARFNTPGGIAIDAAGTVYVADWYNNAIRKITPSGNVSTLAGNGTRGSTDGVGKFAQFDLPSGIAIDVSGNLYVADRAGHRIRKVTPAGKVTTIAGNGTSGFIDGTSVSARFYYPYSLAVAASGNIIYVADEYNNSIRKITLE